MPPERFLLGEDDERTVGRVERGETLDLDEDGVPERWATAEGTCSVAGNCVYALADGATCRSLGLVSGGIDDLRRISTGAWPEIEIDENNLGMTMSVRYRFDGTQYVGAAKRVCVAPEREDPSCRQCDPWEDLGGRPLPVDRWPGLYPHRHAERCDPR